MNAAKEAKLLRRVIDLSGGADLFLKAQVILAWIAIVFGWLAIFIAVFVGERRVVTPFVAVLIGAFGGVVGGMGLNGEAILRRWRMLAQHVDKESIQKRIREIET